MLASVPSRRIASLSVCAILALTFAAPATTLAAIGGSSAFSELTEGQTETTPTQTTATTPAVETTSNSKSVIVFAIGAAVLLLVGIAFMIVRDARSVAPAGDGPLDGGPRRDTAAMMRKRRAKAKAARRQRKQNNRRRK
jgi:hypothetical protein